MVNTIYLIFDFLCLLQVEGFWGCYCHLARASTLPNPTDFHLFKEGIRPLWEVKVVPSLHFAYDLDPKNVNF
jgi:hypothetical protein